MGCFVDSKSTVCEGFMVTEGCKVICMDGCDIADPVKFCEADGSAEGVVGVKDGVGFNVVGLEIGSRLGTGVGLPGAYVGPGNGGPDCSGLGVGEGSEMGSVDVGFE